MYRKYHILLICLFILTNGIVRGQDDPAPADMALGDGLDTSTVDGADVAGSDGGPETSTAVQGSDADPVGETTVEGETPSTEAPVVDSTAAATEDASTAGEESTEAPGATDASSTGSETEGTTSAGSEVTSQTPESVAPTTGGTTVTTVSPVDDKYVPDEQMTQQQRDNSLTIELDLTNADIDWNDPKQVQDFYDWLQITIANLLDQAAKRRKREIDASTKPKVFNRSDVKFAGKHKIINNKLVLSVFVKKPGSTDPKAPAIPKEKLEAIKEKLKEKLLSQKKIKVIKTYTGVPAPVTGAVSDAASDTDDEESLFDAHLGLFLVLIIVSIICLISIIVGVILIKCRGRSGSYQTKNAKNAEEGRGKKRKKPTREVESPISDEEIMKDEAPMIEKGNPALNGDYMSKGEEGWVVPIDELNNEEKLKPEVEDTKL